MRVLDLFCGAGGAAWGYYQGLRPFYPDIQIMGIDIDDQPNYPFHFHQMDVLDVAPGFLREFDFIHASPPCQAYTSLASKDGRHRKLISPIRRMLKASGVPYVIENVEGARSAMKDPVRLCGSTFGLGVRRHRMFEATFDVPVFSCRHNEQGEIRAYYGKRGWSAWTPKGDNVQRLDRKPLLRGSVEQAPADMGIDWMTWDELRESIPPAYTKHIAAAFLASIEAVA